MEFALRETGAVQGRPVYESIEEAFERYACLAVGVECRKELKVVKITIPPVQEGGKPIESTAMRPCLPSPAFEICELANGLFSQENDIAYRIGYITGYKDKDEKKEEDKAPSLDSTKHTEGFLGQMAQEFRKHMQPEAAQEFAEICRQALSMKRNVGYVSGYWQGYNDRAGNVMPKFHYWADPDKEAKDFRW